MDRKPNRTKDIAPGEAGSIEQQLDMVESGPLRGDDLLHTHGAPRRDDLEANYNFDMSEWNREGDEMSGDEHSSGLQADISNEVKRPDLEGPLPGAEAETSTDDFDQVDKDNIDAA